MAYRPRRNTRAQDALYLVRVIGEWFGDGSEMRIIVGTPGEGTEAPARMNLTYAELEVTPPPDPSAGP